VFHFFQKKVEQKTPAIDHKVDLPFTLAIFKERGAPVFLYTPMMTIVVQLRNSSQGSSPYLMPGRLLTHLSIIFFSRNLYLPTKKNIGYAIMGVWSQIAEYLYLKKKDPDRPKSKWVGYMHGINRISLFIFILCLIILFLKLVLK
jgi:hypothetical protein